MKTTCLVPVLAACLLTVGCERQASYSSSDPGGDDPLLVTGLPPELIEGTPVPVMMRGVSPVRVPAASAPGPGTDHVFYRVQSRREVPWVGTVPRIEPPAGAN